MSILSSSPTGIFRRKPVDEVEPEDLQEGGGLQRVLGLWQLTAIGIGGIIGAGIFSLAGAVANEKAGPGVLLSFLVAGVASACAALSYAEFAGMIPKAGSAYTYGYVVLGEGSQNIRDRRRIIAERLRELQAACLGKELDA
jgi:basic amino acid/polyamine antiporter, APA family